MHRKIILSALLFLVWGGALATPAQSEDPTAALKTLYNSGKYEEALNLLNSNTSETSSFYYDSGNVFYRLGQFGLSVANFEKARKLNPHDPEIQHNLAASRTELEKSLGGERLDPASSWIESLSDHLPFDEIRGILGLFALLCAFVWCRSYWKHRRLRLILSEPSGLLSLLAFSLSLALFGAQRIGQSHPAAMCTRSQVVRSGPGEQFLELSRVEAGMKIRVLGPIATSEDRGATQQNGEPWRQVRYSSDGIGWVRSSSLLLL